MRVERMRIFSDGYSNFHDCLWQYPLFPCHKQPAMRGYCLGLDPSKMKADDADTDFKTQTLRWLGDKLEELRVDNQNLVRGLSEKDFDEADEMVDSIEMRLAELSARVAFEARRN